MKKLTFFWKKLIILNLGLLIILVRIINSILRVLGKNAENNSVFPKVSENGYPFFNSINCNIRKLIPIVEELSTQAKNFSDKEIFFSFIDILHTKQCSFIDQISICKDNKKCFKELNQIIPIKNLNVSLTYHSSDNNGNLKISNFITFLSEKNEFPVINSQNKIEIKENELFNHIINGYDSYLGIKLFEMRKNNYDLLKFVTNDEDKMNDLFYFHSLFLKAYTKFTGKKSYLEYANKCLNLSDYIPEQDDHIQNRIIEIFDEEIYNLVNCLPNINNRYSFSIDITAIKTMLKLLFNKNIEKNDKKIFLYYFKELSKSINKIFTADMDLRKKADNYRKYQPYITLAIILIGVAILVLTNIYFVKNKDYYSQGSKLLSRKRYHYYHSEKHEKYLEQLKKYKEMEENNKKNVNNSETKKVSQEELEYIQKLAKENNGDFIFTKK